MDASDPPADQQLIATLPHEMVESQQRLIAWCAGKLGNLRAEHDLMEKDIEYASQHKWRIGPLTRTLARLKKSIVYYEKVRTALEHGYCIVPTFPMDIIAIRSAKEYPRAEAVPYTATFEQKATGLPEGAGDYQNPFPLTRKTWRRQDDKHVEHMEPAGWDTEMEFPVEMAKPKIMELVDDAMKLKLFDEIGFSPPQRLAHTAQSLHSTVAMKPDPMLIGTIIDGARSNTYRRHRVSFLLAWFLDTATI